RLIANTPYGLTAHQRIFKPTKRYPTLGQN
ncbi:unnamed protein product, partial [marine sediment metagenome]